MLSLSSLFTFPRLIDYLCMAFNIYFPLMEDSGWGRENVVFLYFRCLGEKWFGYVLTLTPGNAFLVHLGNVVTDSLTHLNT